MSKHHTADKQAEHFDLADLEASQQRFVGRKHVLSILVANEPGVLARISGLFARRGYNINTLAVGPTSDEKVSRITMTIDGGEHPIDQVTKQLHKLVHVLKIRDLAPAESIARQLALFKIDADAHTRQEISQLADIFHGRIVDVARKSVTVEVTGDEEKVEAFEALVRPFGLIEMVRTGEIAVQRGRHQT